MYNIEQLSVMTGLTTRTLRNYLHMELLQGSKETGVWQFTEEQVRAFVNHPSVRPSIQAKRNAIVYDFLAGRDQTEQELCVLLNRTVSREQAKEIADFFCQAVTGLDQIRFSYSYESGKAHYILKGPEADVSRILQAFSSART